MRPVGFDICYDLRETQQDSAPFEDEVWITVIFDIRIPVKGQIESEISDRLKVELKRSLR